MLDLDVSLFTLLLSLGDPYSFESLQACRQECENLQQLRLVRCETKSPFCLPGVRLIVFLLSSHERLLKSRAYARGIYHNHLQVELKLTSTNSCQPHQPYSTHQSAV